MTKRFITIFFIVLGVMMFLITSFFLVLFLAPGFSAFGMKYIAIGTRAYNSGLVNIHDEIGSFSGSIILNCNEVPVHVEFTENASYQVQYVEDYSGITKTDIEKPTLKVKKDSKGNAVITVVGFEKFLFKNANTERYVNLYIPLTGVSTASTSFRKDLVINSKSSEIRFSKEDETDLRIPQLNIISVKTSGKVSFDTYVKTMTYKYESPNTIFIDKENKLAPDSSSYTLKSEKGKIVVKKEVSGDLNLTTNNASVSLISCRNLKTRTGFGSVKCYIEGKKIKTTGSVNIKTSAGKVTLGEVLGGAESLIETGSGAVKIDSIKKVSITTKSGDVTIKSLTEAKIVTNLGTIDVEECLSKINIDAKRGNVLLGGSGMTMNNATVFAKLGKIKMFSASENVDIQTVKGNIEFTNKDSKNIKIVSGGKLTAKNLTGKVDITSAKDAELSFSNVTDTSNISLGDKCKKLVIWAVSNTKGNTRYSISGKSATRWEDNANNTGTYSKVESSPNGLVNRLTGIEPLITANGKNADIHIYLKSESEDLD